jgi:hypothetical protein
MMKKGEELTIKGSFAIALSIFATGLIGGYWGWLALVCSLLVFLLFYYFGLYKPLKKLEGKL